MLFLVTLYNSIPVILCIYPIPPPRSNPAQHPIGNRRIPRADPHSLPDFMQQTDELVFERLRRIDNWQLTVDNYVPQPCLFEKMLIGLTQKYDKLLFEDFKRTSSLL